jgi:hypothetical protein
VSIALNSSGDAPEYSAPTSLTIDALNNLSLSDYSIVDPSTTKEYTFAITQSTVYGQFYVGNVVYGNSLNISGTRSNINSLLSSSGTYWKSTAAASNSANLVLNIQRTSPGIATIASNVICNLSITIPSPGTTWQGGVYLGEANAAISGSDYYIIGDASSLGFTTGGQELRVLPQSATSQQLIAISYLKKPQEFTGPSGTTDFPQSFIQTLVEWAANTISLPQDGSPTLYQSSEKDAAQLFGFIA